jgi:hypothetical protein
MGSLGFSPGRRQREKRLGFGGAKVPEPEGVRRGVECAAGSRGRTLPVVDTESEGAPVRVGRTGQVSVAWDERGGPLSTPTASPSRPLRGPAKRAGRWVEGRLASSSDGGRPATGTQQRSFTCRPRDIFANPLAPIADLLARKGIEKPTPCLLKPTMAKRSLGPRQDAPQQRLVPAPTSRRS